MQYIHYKCLKHFIDIKMQKKADENFKFYTWKNFECEICKYEYPKYLKYKNTIYPMVDIENDYDSYAICDYTLFDDNTAPRTCRCSRSRRARSGSAASGTA